MANFISKASLSATNFSERYMYANGTNYVFTSRQGYLELYEYVDGSFVFRSNLWVGYQYNYSNNLKGKSDTRVFFVYLENGLTSKIAFVVRSGNIISYESISNEIKGLGDFDINGDYIFAPCNIYGLKVFVYDSIGHTYTQIYSSASKHGTSTYSARVYGNLLLVQESNYLDVYLISYSPSFELTYICSTYDDNAFVNDIKMIDNYVIAPTYGGAKIKIFEFTGSELNLKSITQGQYTYGGVEGIFIEGNKLYFPGLTMSVFLWNDGNTMPLYGTFNRGAFGYNIKKAANSNFYVCSSNRLDLVEEVIPPPVYSMRYDNITTVNNDGTKHFYYKDLETNKKNFVEYFPPNIR